MSKRPTDDLEPAAKKRGNTRQLTKDDASDEEEEERGVLETASEDIMKKRRIVKARRGTGAPPSTPTAGPQKAANPANPFAGISLFGGANTPEQANPPSTAAQGPTAAAIAPVATATETKAAEQPVRTDPQPSPATPDGKAAEGLDAGLASDERADTAQEPAAQQKENEGQATDTKGTEAPKPAEISAPGFASLAATAQPFAAVDTSKAFGFGSLANGSAGTNGSQAGSKDAAKPFNFGTSSTAFGFQPKEGGFPAVPSIFGANTQPGGQSGPEPDTIKPALATLPPELETVTGEEGENVLWSGEGSLYEFDAAKSWKERGKGELRINRAPGRPARFVMRQRGHHRLLMNANLWPQMKVTPMDGGKGATFPVINDANSSEGAAEPKLQTFAFRLKAASQLSAFIEAIEEHKQLPKGEGL